MIHTMEGQLDNLKPRKRKNNSEARSSRKVSATGRCVRSPKRHSAAAAAAAAAESSSAGDGCRGPAYAPERISRISCECHLSAGRRRCSASPELGGREGKENELRAGPDGDHRGNNTRDKREPELMDYEERGKIVFFPDDDSNEILPVEQFFGNLDTLQDFPQRSSAACPSSHREHRRRHYYAPDDSDEEEAAAAAVVVVRGDGAGT